MNNKYSSQWNRSTQTRKQRKYRHNAPLNVRQRFLAAPLAEALRKKYGKRTAQVRKGDTVTILRGQFNKHKGKVDRVDIKRSRIFIEGAQTIKRDGSKILYPIHASKVRIEDLVLEDKKRKAMFEVKK
ncbi:MAG: 50S ribosomal protein L24 [Candidatus Woesearchaeota archaeon]|nr:50S ribosomal protein L24 [Candidatus Woesearchaeota archaeon]